VIVFLILYVTYIVVSVILLLNLLIAMMSATFEEVSKVSTLKCRTGYARCVIRYELIAASFGMDVSVGEKDNDRFVFKFRTIDRNSEGRRSAGNSDPFYDADMGDTSDYTRANYLEEQEEDSQVAQIRREVCDEMEARIARLLSQGPMDPPPPADNSAAGSSVADDDGLPIAFRPMRRRTKANSAPCAMRMAPLTPIPGSPASPVCAQHDAQRSKSVLCAAKALA